MRRMFFIFLAVVVLVSFGCKNRLIDPTPERQDDVVEVMYERTLPVSKPDAPDPTRPNPIMSDETGGGINSPDWTKKGPNTFQFKTPLPYSLKLYHNSTPDQKVTNEITPLGAVARTYYARVVRDDWIQPWVKLSTSPNGVVRGEQADFYLNINGISTPNQE